ncbi:MAG: hypothetical protein K6F70_04755 [Eggerthellaceae bacterium]|nr:hypothetical protein [Eggerthellaceae bacterium]
MRQFAFLFMGGARARRPRAVAILVMLALLAAAVSELLEGHECTGDGCVLCLIAACAHALLVVCAGFALAQTVLGFVFNPSRLGLSASVVARAVSSLVGCASLARIAETPVRSGVCLRI